MTSWVQQSWGAAPVLVWCGAVYFLRGRGMTWSDAMMRATAGWAAVVWIVSNGLSWFDVLNADALKLVWLAAVVCMWGIALRGPRRITGDLMSGTPDTWERVVALGVGVLMAVTLITAVVSPPVTVDVLSYHAPRQLMWLQQGSLAHFLTVNDRQLMMPPLAEVIGVQFLALTGDDRWANLPQWFAYVMTAVALASCVRAKDGTRRQAWLAAGLWACLPMAYLESGNGKNDLQGALWVTLILRETIRARREGGSVPMKNALYAGLLVALALLTKSTALLFAPPLIVVALLGWWRRESRVGVGRLVVMATLATLLMTAPFFGRNLLWYGTPLGVHRAEDGGHQENEAVSPTILASNVLRNATLHLASPWPSWNQGLANGVAALHRKIGVSTDDRSTTCWGATYQVAYAPNEETIAGAPWHFLLIALAIGAACLWRRAAPWAWLGWSCAAMAISYCFVLKWQPWGARLQQPLFAVGVLLIAGVAGSWQGRARSWVAGVLLVFGAVGWWPSRQASARPWTGETSIFTQAREDGMYRYLELLQDRDRAYVDLVKTAGVTDLLIVSVHDMPYTLMRRLQREVPALRFHGAPMRSGETPEAILKLELFRPLGLYHEFTDGRRYRLVGASSGDGLYLAEEHVKRLKLQDQMPAFAGWTSHEGLAFRSGRDGRNSSSEIWREMAGERAEVRFNAPQNSMQMSATVRKSSPGAGRLEFTINGQVLREVELPAGTGEFVIKVMLPCRLGHNLLGLRRIQTEGGALHFMRLVVDDAP